MCQSVRIKEGQVAVRVKSIQARERGAVALDVRDSIRDLELGKGTKIRLPTGFESTTFWSLNPYAAN